MQQSGLFHESMEEALSEVVAACGGRKSVAIQLWPGKTARDAHNHMDACLNAGRPEKFSLAELMFLLRAGQAANCHAAMHFLASETGYRAPEPVDAQQRQADLMREFLEMGRRMESLGQKIGIDHKLPGDLRAVK